MIALSILIGIMVITAFVLVFIRFPHKVYTFDGVSNEYFYRTHMRKYKDFEWYVWEPVRPLVGQWIFYRSGDEFHLDMEGFKKL